MRHGSGKMFIVELVGRGCPYVNLAQELIVKNLLAKTLKIIKREQLGPLRSRVFQPGYPGWEGVGGNVIFNPKGYVSAITFADKGEFWLTLAPFGVGDLDLFELIKLSSIAFKARIIQPSLSPVSEARLDKILAHFEAKDQTAPQ